MNQKRKKIVKQVIFFIVEQQDLIMEDKAKMRLNKIIAHRQKDSLADLKEFKRKLRSIFNLFQQILTESIESDVRNSEISTQISFNKPGESHLCTKVDKQIQVYIPDIPPKRNLVDAETQTNNQNLISYVAPASVFYKQSIIFEEEGQSFFSNSNNITEIPHISQAIEENISLLINSYKFVPKNTTNMKKFRVICQSYEFLSEQGELIQAISVNPVSKDEMQSIKFKIIHSSAFNIYIGLGNTTRLNKSHSAKSRDASTVSFHPLNKKRFYVLTESQMPIYLPIIRNGDIVQMVVKYQQQEIRWLCNDVEMGITRVNFNNDNWYPFITMKCKGDIIEVL